ncbi:type II toxin-antitoxin system HicA family toxin [Rhodobacteraceae bacterium nBUS_24]
MGRDTKKIIKRLKREGWTLRNVKGSHHQFVKDENRLTIPHPKKGIYPLVQQRLSHAPRSGLREVINENIFCSGQQRS